MSRAKSAAVKRLEGNPGKSRLPESLPTLPAASTRCPAFLAEEARPYWRRLAPRLRKLGLLSELDVPALADLCVCWARLDACELDVKTRGLLVNGERGKVKNPACQLARQYRDQLWKLAARFGLTPVDRRGLDVHVSEPEDGLEAFLSGRTQA